MALARQYVEQHEYTEAEYFALEEKAFERSEYVNGEIRMMAGGTDDHGAICANIGRALGNMLIPKRCRVFNSDVKVHCSDGTNCYPDVSAICGPIAHYAGRRDTYINPLVIVEVLSPSTAKYDAGEKFEHYKTVPSLTDYLLVAPDEPRVTLHTRDGDQWSSQTITGLSSTIHLPSVDITLALSDFYALIEFNLNASETAGTP